MPKCETITTRRTWCRRDARPGGETCTVHRDGPFFELTFDDYRVADAVERERERVAWEQLPAVD